MKIKYIIEFYLVIGIPLIYLLVLASISQGQTIQIPLIFQLFGILSSITGIVFWITSYLQLGQSFGVLPRTQKIVRKGLYARYKHPMYIGITLTFFGLSLANQSFMGLITTVCLLLPILFIRAKLEERKLQP